MDDVVCKICQSSFISYPSLLDHIRVYHTSDILQCFFPKCTRVYSSFNSLRKHIGKCHEISCIKVETHEKSVSRK